mgnify:CR=1 FL=1
MASLIGIDEARFQEEVVEAASPVLVDFWATWCGYCTKLSPVLEELADEMAGKMKFVKINVDENRKLAEKYEIKSLPTMALFKNGDLVEKITGFMPKTSIMAKVNSWL